MGDSDDIERATRRAWEFMIRTALPRAASRQGWPVTSPADFERILLDHVAGAPRTGPASVLDLVLAVEVGARAIDGEVCLRTLERRSRAMRAADPARDIGVSRKAASV